MKLEHNSKNNEKQQSQTSLMNKSKWTQFVNWMLSASVGCFSAALGAARVADKTVVQFYILFIL